MFVRFALAHPPRVIEWSSLNYVLFGTDNGVMNQMTPLDTSKVCMLRNHASALWGMDFNPYTLQSVSVGADGVLMLARTGQKRGHVLATGIELAALTVVTQDSGSNGSNETNGNAAVTMELRTDEAVVPLKEVLTTSDLNIPRECSLYSVSWNKLKQTLKWVAFGGENGILFVHRIKTKENFAV